MFSDREVLIGLFDLLSAIAEKLTGERPIVRFETEDGQWMNVCEDRGRITWSRPDPHSDQASGQPASRSAEATDSIPSV